jgi:N-methylhydantoinase A
VPREQEQLYWQKKHWRISWYERSQLEPGMKLEGPAVIAEFSATTFVPPGWELRCDAAGNLILNRI